MYSIYEGGGVEVFPANEILKKSGVLKPSIIINWTILDGFVVILDKKVYIWCST